MEPQLNLTEYITALKNIQGELQNPPKSKSGHNYMYPELPNILDTLRPKLKDNGFVMTSSVGISDTGHMVLITTLAHISGVEQKFQCPIYNQKENMQGMGSAITYARRYLAMSIFNIIGEDEDDDGVGSQNEPPRFEPKAKASIMAGTSGTGGQITPPAFTNNDPPPVSDSKITTDQREFLRDWAKENGMTPKDMSQLIKTMTGLDSSLKLNQKQYREICNHLEIKL